MPQGFYLAHFVSASGTKNASQAFLPHQMLSHCTKFLAENAEDLYNLKEIQEKVLVLHGVRSDDTHSILEVFADKLLVKLYSSELTKIVKKAKKLQRAMV